MKKLPIGIQSIEKILSNGEYVYVDKTGFIKKLIDEGSPHYFMSRPRRFGKSLFVSTLEEVFKGNKDLFKGCEIYESNYPWHEHPVLHFDFTKILSKTPEDFKKGIEDSLEDFSKLYGISISGSSYLSKLNRLVVSLSNRNKVVVLIDEYDKPIINNLKDLDVAEQNRDLMRDFFGTLKSLDQHLKFTFVTGVSKFSQVSLFSGPNNLKDITMDRRYAGMMGYTSDEIRHHFSKHVQSIVQEFKKDKENIFEEIRAWYNGYRFSKEEIYVYNPFSTLNFMDEKEAKSYWYRSGTPSFLLDQVRLHPKSILSMKGTRAIESSLLDISRFDRINLAALMFQTGYLTISNYDPRTSVYSLDFPNREVKQAFFESLAQDFAEVNSVEISSEGEKIKTSLEECNLSAFVEKMNIHFAKISYQVFSKAKEGFYQAVFFTFLEVSGIPTMNEISTNIGRIDLVSDLKDMLCIFELKLDQTADIAFSQVEAKKYREGLSGAKKSILVVGINFSSKFRNISDWKGALFSSDGKLEKEII